MPGQWPGSRFGQDSYPRMATATDSLVEASAVLPFQPMYQSLLPFLPPSIVSGSGGSTTGSGLLAASVTDGGPDAWSQYADRLDLKAWQGDDVQIPLYFQNPGDPSLDMSDENGWSWKAQIRLYTDYMAPYVAEFVIQSDAVLPVPPDTVTQTLVTLFLPRRFNGHCGIYSWELASTGPFTGPSFPRPPSIPATEWPPADMVKTWLYGYYYCVPRVTQTDWLPVPSNVIPAGTALTVTPVGVFIPPGGPDGAR